MRVTIAQNIVWHNTHVDRRDRERILRQQGCTIWFTGLPSAGKSTAAFTLEHGLIKRGYAAYVLDGDNIRHGLNSNLGFSLKDREENIRRIGEVAKLFADAGLLILTSFISPFRKDRELVRQLHKDAGLVFIEVYVDTPLEICESRDPKGLYKKARSGALKGVTGVDDPYEPPLTPEITLNTGVHSPEECAAQLLAFLLDNGHLKSEIKDELREQ